MGKPKFNKKKCLVCIYSVKSSQGYPTHDEEGKPVSLICDYASNNRNSECCLYIGEDGKVHDRRGDKYNKCLLFTPGKKDKEPSDLLFD